ncbi:hypothetical protein [Halorubrum sp. FL23]|uniref:hypothetical protein n=1 Tax=Halorubrum sp. FL23 TaxID=3458704 RepID=UPI0040340983
MTKIPEKYELPDGWEPTIAELVDFNTLCAVYESENSETMIRIAPIPTDRFPEFTHSHRVLVDDPEEETELVADGREVDDVIDAKLVAVEAMKEVSEM